MKTEIKTMLEDIIKNNNGIIQLEKPRRSILKKKREEYFQFTEKEILEKLVFINKQLDEIIIKLDIV